MSDTERHKSYEEEEARAAWQFLKEQGFMHDDEDEAVEGVAALLERHSMAMALRQMAQQQTGERLSPGAAEALRQAPAVGSPLIQGSASDVVSLAEASTTHLPAHPVQRLTLKLTTEVRVSDSEESKVEDE